MQSKLRWTIKLEHQIAVTESAQKALQKYLHSTMDAILDRSVELAASDGRVQVTTDDIAKATTQEAV